MFSLFPIQFDVHVRSELIRKLNILCIGIIHLNAIFNIICHLDYIQNNVSLQGAPNWGVLHYYEKIKITFQYEEGKQYKDIYITRCDAVCVGYEPVLLVLENVVGSKYGIVSIYIMIGMSFHTYMILSIDRSL